jgi:hypothetical protein
LSTRCYLDGHVCVDCARVCALNQDDFSVKTREWIRSNSCSSNAVPPVSTTITATIEFDDEIGHYDPFKRKEDFRSLQQVNMTLIASAKRSKSKKDPKRKDEKVLSQRVAEEVHANPLTPSSNIPIQYLHRHLLIMICIGNNTGTFLLTQQTPSGDQCLTYFIQLPLIPTIS